MGNPLGYLQFPTLMEFEGTSKSGLYIQILA
jgi:hypothetical protein